MSRDEYQRDFFKKLRRLGVTPKDADSYTKIGEFEIYRVFRGERRLSAREIGHLLLHDNLRVRDEVMRFLTGGRTCLFVAVTGEGLGNVDEGTANAVKLAADLVAKRMANTRDGVVTEAERDAEIAVIDDSIRTLHALKIDAANQPVSKPARKLGIAKGA